MRILIIDDEKPKSDAIRTYVTDLPTQTFKEFSVVDNMGEAVRLFSTIKFDLIIIDLMLPAFPDATKDSSAGAELVGQLRRATCMNVSTPALGLSAYPEEIETFRGRFEKHGILIVAYDDVGSWKMPVEALVQETQRVRNDKRVVDFVIIVALEEERAAFAYTNIDIIRPLIVAGLNVIEVRTKGTIPKHGVIIRLSQMGLVSSSYESTLVVNNFSSPIVCMSGICAGLRDHTQLGQLVVASSSWDYQAGKWSDNNFEIAALQLPIRAATKVVLDLACADSSFISALEDHLPFDLVRPAQRVVPVLAPLATGSAVIADVERLKVVSRQHRKLAGIDIECFGMYYACHHCVTPVRHFFAVKSVVDFADNKKGDSIHQYGCIVSARFCMGIIERLHLDES